jgi:predicted lipoprotein with Yx(FWY)xxD motif
MKGLLIITAVLASTVALAACGGGGGSGTSGAAASSPSSMAVSAKSGVLVDSKGMALYASDQEMNGKVMCSGACTSFWKPLTVSGGMPSGGSLTGKLGAVTRPDGTKQVTYNGKLLYTFSQDSPGKVTGDGFSDAFGGRHFTWHVVHSGKSTSSSSNEAAAKQDGSYGY